MLMRVCALVILSTLASLSHAEDDRVLPADPAIVTGTLENGLTYLVRRHAVPPGRATVWIHIHSGALNETDRQCGLAHYLEHMAFNGSENFKPGSLVPFFQSLGMTFGRDQNAFTNHEQTTYILSLPDAGAETMGKGLLFFSDVLFRLLLTPEEIESERQIIKEERRRGLSARQRTGDEVQKKLAPGTVWSLRDVIGSEASLSALKREDFTDYYGKWYVASNATVMVVADAEPSDVVKLIGEKFGPAPKKERPASQASGVKAYEKSFAIVASDGELTSEEVRIVRLEPERGPVRTVGRYREELVVRLGEAAMNRRLEAKLAKGGTSWQSGRVSVDNSTQAAYEMDVVGRCAPGKWKATLQELALELQRARAFGFGAQELAAAKKQVLSAAERIAETQGTAAAGVLVGRMNAAATTGDVMVAPAKRVELLKEMLPAITAEDVAKAFAKEFDPSAVAFVAVLPAGAGVPTEAQLLEIGLAALAVKPEKEAEEAHATQLLAKAPEGGKVEGAPEEHAASKVWSAWLGNGARLRYRFMDERKSDATATITLIGGDLRETAENRGITGAARLAWSQSATKALSSTDIRELMTGKKVGVGPGGGGGGRGRRGGGGGGAAGTISLTISGSPEDFETGFQLAYLLLTQPRIEEAAFDQFRTAAKQFLAESIKTANGVGGRAAGSLPFPDDDPRFRPIEPAQIDKLTLAAAQAWLEVLLAESPIEIAIVGDIPKDRAFDLAARYIGALPARKKPEPALYMNLRTLKRPAGPRVFEKTIESTTDQAYVSSGFYGADATNLADSRALTMAARILSTRMTVEVREKAQLVYSIGASSRAAATFPGFGLFNATAPTEPGKADALVAKLAEMYVTFAKGGPTEEEMTVAKKQMANVYDESLKEPSFWSGRLDLLTWPGIDLDDLVAEPAAFQAMTAEQVKAAFAKYYDSKNAIVVVVKPGK